MGKSPLASLTTDAPPSELLLRVRGGGGGKDPPTREGLKGLWLWLPPWGSRLGVSGDVSATLSSVNSTTWNSDDLLGEAEKKGTKWEDDHLQGWLWR